MFKNSFLNLFIFGILAIAVAQDDYNLANTILSSVASIQYDPAKSAQCFSVYLPKLNDITNEYESQYQTCLEKSINSKDDVRQAVAHAADSLNNSVDQICSAFANCEFGDDPSAYFECSNDAAGRATSQAYSIQTLSQDRVQYIKLKYETIQYNQNVCAAKASDVYAKDTASVHAKLQDCLAGKETEESATEY
ncbi:uncharacterized protein LOC133321491 [Musca vetustissima]|uniref:uncharacterized protein LOC133321491 n=1 Tax=Musca vetustissima TaxID=27455 RepID=UPI002AB72B66|nr:uncharacterized protein LOC133321491 [Musca vetustissima]